MYKKKQKQSSELVMKKVYVILLIALAALAAAYFYAMQIINNITYTFSLAGFNIWNVSLTKDSVIKVTVNLNINNKNPFTIPIKYLYYEIYYNNSLIAKSSDSDNNKLPITILGNTANQIVSQSIDVHVNNSALKIVSQVLAKKDTAYSIKLYANIFGINLKLKNIDYTYKQT